MSRKAKPKKPLKKSKTSSVQMERTKAQLAAVSSGLVDMNVAYQILARELGNNLDLLLGHAANFEEFRTLTLDFMNLMKTQIADMLDRVNALEERVGVTENTDPSVASDE